MLKDGFKAVVDKMFEDCVNLKNVTLSNGLQSIGNNAFDGCIGLTAIEIPDSVKSVGQSAFSECTALSRAVNGGGVTDSGVTFFISALRLKAWYLTKA